MDPVSALEAFVLERGGPYVFRIQFRGLRSPEETRHHENHDEDIAAIDERQGGEAGEVEVESTPCDYLYRNGEFAWASRLATRLTTAMVPSTIADLVGEMRSSRHLYSELTADRASLMVDTQSPRFVSFIRKIVTVAGCGAKLGTPSSMQC
jgi:hypothetical protein